MVGVMVVLVVLVLVVVSSQLSKCAYRGWYLTKLMVRVMVVLVVLPTQTLFLRVEKMVRNSGFCKIQSYGSKL